VNPGASLRHLPNRPPPAGYVAASCGGTNWIVRRDCAVSLEASGAVDLLRGRPGRAGGPGRGRSGFVRLRLGTLAAVGKRSRHGGVFGGLLGGAFVGAGRVVAVVEAATRLDAQGVRTPAVLAAGWRRIAGPLQAHALVTEEVPGATTMQEAIGAAPATHRRRAILAAVGEAVRAMHAAGFVHADLNMGNLLLDDAPGSPRAHVVDLDRGRFVPRMGGRRRLSNLRRLLRSWEKWLGGRVPPGPRDAVAFLHAYCGGDRSAMRRLLRRLAVYRSLLCPRRFAWRLLARRHAGATGPARHEQG
jgi:hypothetical protein